MEYWIIFLLIASANCRELISSRLPERKPGIVELDDGLRNNHNIVHYPSSTVSLTMSTTFLRVKLCHRGQNTHQFHSCIHHFSTQHLLRLIKKINVFTRTFATSPNKSNVDRFSNFACSRSSIRISQLSRTWDERDDEGSMISIVNTPTSFDERITKSFSNCRGEKVELGRRMSALVRSTISQGFPNVFHSTHVSRIGLQPST